LENNAELSEKRAHILSELRAIRERQPFEYTGGLVNEARQAREDEMGRIWHSDT
jgi:hypothetical protein